MGLDSYNFLGSIMCVMPYFGTDTSGYDILARLESVGCGSLTRRRQQKVEKLGEGEEGEEEKGMIVVPIVTLSILLLI